MTTAEAPAPPPRWDLRSSGTRAFVLILAGLIVLHVLGWKKTEVSPHAFTSGYHGMVEFIGEAFPPDLNWKGVVHPAITATLVTFYTALLGTTFALPFSIAGAILGARNTSPHPVIYQLTRSVMSFLRAIPDIVFGLIFVTAVGLGPFAGVLALSFHSIGVLGKLLSEAIEEMDEGPLEALRVAGASRTQVVTQAVLPTTLPTLVGLMLFRLDDNVRSSLTLGLIGAGGIGFLITSSINLFQFDQMLTQILVVLVLVAIVDNLSSLIRRRMA